MNDPILLACLSLAASWGLCLGLPRHWRQCLPTALPGWGYRLLRGWGWLSLIAALGVGADQFGWSRGPLIALGYLMVAALALTLLLTWRPRLVAVSGMAASLSSLLLLLQPLAHH